MLMKNKSKCLLPNPQLIYDEACLDITNYRNSSVEIYGQYAECEKCAYQSLAVLKTNESTSLLVNTKYSLSMHYTVNNTTSCSWEQTLLEHYRYGWKLTNATCTPIYIKVPAENAYLPILTAFIILFFFGTIWYMVKCIYKCTRNRNHWRRYIRWTPEGRGTTDGNNEATGVTQEGTPLITIRHPNRIKSLDVFRGFCIIMMIFVNYGGGQYWLFKHSVWNGLTFADLVFPWFLWIMGVSLVVSLRNRLRHAVPRRHLVFHILQRSFVLILLGIILNSHGNPATLDKLRFPGVLQRIGVTYLIVGLLETVFTKRTETVPENRYLRFLQDIIVAWPQWIIVIGLVSLHTIITFLVEVPGCGRGYLGPGGLHDYGQYYNCTGGVAGYIDRKFFGEHMYKRPTCQKIYETVLYYDPEGVLGILTSVLLVYLGVQFGRILVTYVDVKARVIRWTIWGAVIGLLGGVLCKFSKNDGIIPLNKNLWSLSFVLVLAGLAFFIQAFLFIIVDITRKWGGRPCFYPGMNALALYVGSEVFKGIFPFGWIPSFQTHAAYLGMNLWGTAVWVAIAIFLYKRNIFLTL